MTLKQLQTTVNSKLATFWTALQTREEAYFAKHNKYFQLLVGSNLTLDGANTSFSVNLPNDELYVNDIDTSWSDIIPFQIEVHEWNGNTKGFKANVVINYQGILYRRERDSSNVDSGWYEHIVPTTP